MAFDDREETGSAAKTDGSAQPRVLDGCVAAPVRHQVGRATGLFILAVFYTMYFMRAMLLPLVLALLLSYLLVPLVRGACQARIPPALRGRARAARVIAAIALRGISSSPSRLRAGSKKRLTVFSNSNRNWFR